jgi:hypothetical protein
MEAAGTNPGQDGRDGADNNKCAMIEVTLLVEKEGWG